MIPKRIAATKITFKNLPTLPGSLFTNARIMKYRVAAPITKNTKNLIIIINLTSQLN